MSQLPMRDVPVVTPQGPDKANLREKNTITAARSNRVGSAYQRLRELIVHGKLVPGSSVIEADLSTRLGICRTPVREALRLLQQEGFLIRNPAGATKSRLVVAPLMKEDARELYWIVGRLEGLEKIQAESRLLRLARCRPQPGGRVSSLNRLRPQGRKQFQCLKGGCAAAA
jgi:DNA-binding transcriptional MocR family regulator